MYASQSPCVCVCVCRELDSRAPVCGVWDSYPSNTNGDRLRDGALKKTEAISASSFVSYALRRGEGEERGCKRKSAPAIITCPRQPALRSAGSSEADIQPHVQQILGPGICSLFRATKRTPGNNPE